MQKYINNLMWQETNVFLRISNYSVLIVYLPVLKGKDSNVETMHVLDVNILDKALINGL